MTQMKKFQIAALVFTALIFSFSALADPVLGKLRVYTITCDSTVKTLAPVDTTLKLKSFVHFRWWVNSTTPVFVGGTDVDTTGGVGMPYCTDAAVCVKSNDSMDGNPFNMSCKAASAVSVIILAGVK